MNSKSIRKIINIGATIVVLLMCFLGRTPGTLAKGNSVIQLQSPSFLSSTPTQNSSALAPDLGAKLDAEAGIAAYYKAPDAITLSQVRDQFRTIEADTTDYIIGSVAVPNHPERFDAHVYVNQNGWILAYYLRSDPVSIIADVKAATVNNTKLKSVVAIIAGAAGAPFSDVTYYDFRYPNATNILLVGEDNLNGNEFTITLPSSYGYFERSWALYNTTPYMYDVRLDGAPLIAEWSGSNLYFGTIDVSKLSLDIPHIIKVVDYSILAIEYRVP